MRGSVHLRFRTACDEHKEYKGITFTEPSRTKQSDLEACDINNIMARYAATGVVDHFAAGQPLYGDFSEVEDYQTSLEKVISAEERFNSLPSELRKKFDYNPQNMIDFILDERNREECIQLGFINKPALENSQNIGTDSNNTLHSDVSC